MAAGDGLRVAVNISGRHLQQGNLTDDVRHALAVSGLDPGSLVIELTESTIMQNTEVNLERFRELKALGVRLAIDDFGMGYSSLSYLHRFPIDILKIDRAFVSRMTEQNGGPELARAVVMLGTTLGLETVAEGIENEDQVAYLLDLGCVAGQGFLFSSSCTLDAVSRTPFMDRRAQLRAERAAYAELTATGTAFTYQGRLADGGQPANGSYDLRFILEERWAELGPKLAGKIHIAMGDADNYFLNNAARLLDAFFQKAEPRFDGRMVFAPMQGHCYTGLSDLEMMKEMGARVAGR